MPPAKKSEVWNHFTASNKKAKCHHCSLSLAYNPSIGTGNLVRHMKRRHGDVLFHREISSPAIIAATSNSMNLASVADLKVTPSSSTEMLPKQEPQTTPQTYRTSTPNLTPDCMTGSKPSSVHLDKRNFQLLKMIVTDYHPFGIVEVPEFRNFVHLLCPSYEIPSKKTISDSLLPAVYYELKENIKAWFKPGPPVCLTVEGWSSHETEDNFYAITAHFIDENTTLQNVLLDCIHYEERYTVDNISTMLKDVTVEWGIQNNVIAIVTDDASDTFKAAKILGWKDVRCLAHSLNLAINKGLEYPGIKNLVKKVRNIVEYFKSSPYALSRLQDNEQNLNLPAMKLKLDCATRWNSTYEMLTRFQKAKNAIINTLAMDNPEINTISMDEWEVIEKCIEVLKVFYVVTESLCAENHVSLSKVPIYVSSMLESFNEHLVEKNDVRLIEMCEIIKSEIYLRFGSVETDELIAQATILDPRIKHHGLSSDNAEKAIAELKEVCVNRKMNNEEGDDSETNMAESKEDLSQSLLWGKFDEKVKNMVAPQSGTASSNKEIDKYLNEELLDRKEDPFIWWKLRKEVYPQLYKVMLERLCITACSVPGETIFSKKGQTWKNRRKLLKPEKCSEIVFLSHNLK